jgi:hypothetical protein
VDRAAEHAAIYERTRTCGSRQRHWVGDELDRDGVLLDDEQEEEDTAYRRAPCGSERKCGTELSLEQSGKRSKGHAALLAGSAHCAAREQEKLGSLASGQIRKEGLGQGGRRELRLGCRVMRPSGPAACEAGQMQRRGQHAFGPEQRKGNISFSFFISNFPNAFSNIDLNRI